MKLKDKFDSTIMRHDLGRNEFEETKEQCAEIAEEFAIGFGEYLDSLTYQDMGELTIKELLEIYKKEKGL
jgi:hypothetical protein